MARQSSWFLTFAPEMVTLSLSPTSKASVLCPSAPLSPALLSMVIPLKVRVLAPSMLNTWTGEFLIVIPEIVEDVREWA